MKARIFVSHSTNVREARAYLEELRSAFAAEEFLEPQWDLLLEPGDRWKDEIFRWMDEAHGAVILLSREALESTFVPIELAILSFRYCREQKFPLIVVLIGDVQPEDIEQGVIGELDLGRIQYVRNLGPAEAARKVMTTLRSFFARQKPRTPRQILEEAAACLLEKTELTESDLQEVAVGAGLQALDRSSRASLRQDFARLLLGAEFELACWILRNLANRKGSAAGQLLEILRIVAPFWIAEQEAVPIAEVALAEKERRLLALDVQYPTTAHAFVCRASMQPLGQGWRVCDLAPPDEEESLASLTRQVLDQIRPRKSLVRNIDEAMLKETLLAREREGKPVFVLFPREWTPDRRLLTEMRRDLPTLVVVAMAGLGPLTFPDHSFQGLAGPDAERERRSWTTYVHTESELQYHLS